MLERREGRGMKRELEVGMRETKRAWGDQENSRGLGKDN